jgi:hypothetical protein
VSHWGRIPNTFADARKTLKPLGGTGGLSVCYEAGSTGYGPTRMLNSWGRSSP